MIREAEEKDIEHIIDMAREFWKHTIYDVEFVEDDVALMIQNCISDGLAYVYVDEIPRGFICAVVGPLLANFSVSVATELAWWVDQPYRKTGAGYRLVKALEDAAIDMDVDYISMISMKSSTDMSDVYKRMGYQESELNYVRAL